jgi:lipid-A-disaccharide synthase
MEGTQAEKIWRVQEKIQSQVDPPTGTDIDDRLLSQQARMNQVTNNYPGDGRKSPLFFISAGDPSGDIYGGALVRELKYLFPESFFLGLGGKEMAREGVHLLAPPERIATVGFTEIIRDIPFFHGLLKESDDIFRVLSPDLVILIDYPGFNLRLARRAKKRGMKTLFYVSPQIWAWYKGRCKGLVRDSDEIAVILPFEVEVFREWGKEVHYVGHPMIREITRRESKETFMKRYGISPDRPVLGLSPGSRRKEIAYHLPLFLEIADRIRQKIPEVQVLINRAPTMGLREMRESYLREYGDVKVINDSHHTSIDISSLFLTKSGTSTLEAALLHTPMLVCYRMSQISFIIAKALVNLSHISLVNILAGREIVPEYIQSDFKPDKIVPEALKLLEDTPKRQKMIRELKKVSGILEGDDANEKVAKLAVSMVGKGRGI